MHGKAMSSRCQEAESALLVMPLKQGKALSMREPVVAPEISLKIKKSNFLQKEEDSGVGHIFNKRYKQ